MHLPDTANSFVLRTDASSVQTGAVLLQPHGHKIFPIGFHCEKLSEREQECLASVTVVLGHILTGTVALRN